MAETQDGGINLNYHPAMETIRLQCAVDAHMTSQLTGHVNSERAVHGRMSLMQTLISSLHKHRKDMEDDPNELANRDTSILEAHIQRFSKEHWPALNAIHEGILVDSKHPFGVDSLDVNNNETYLSRLENPDDVADSIDKLRELLEMEQYTLSHITRDLTALTQQNDLLTQVHTRSMRKTGAEQMVANQKTRG